MFDRLRKIFSGTKAPAVLTGAPTIRRQKTYSAASGYVYQYFYLGKREADVSAGSSIEFVFEVSSDRKTTFPVSVFVPDRALASWCAAAGRELAPNERYALAKMALFSAFDERPEPQAMHDAVLLNADDVNRIADALGF